MTTRGQNLRSSTPGNMPAAGTRQPGEIWMTFPDKQFGIIDATKTAQPMIAVRFFSTTANYVTGDIVVQAGAIYIAKGAVTAGAFNSTQWSKIAALTDIPVVYVLPTASTSVLGGVKIDGTTVKIDGSGVISSAGLVAVATTPPVSPQNGSLWYDLVGGQLYAWVNDGTSSQWVVAVNQSLGGVYLPMSGGTLTGPLNGTTATFSGAVNAAGATLTGQFNGVSATFSSNVLSNGFFIDLPAGFEKLLYGRTSGVQRWAVSLGNGAPETGSSVGSNFAIYSYGDGGGLAFTPISIVRNTGVTTFSSAIVNGPSDRTLKENITPLQGSLAKVKTLQGVAYNFIATPDKREIGLIAQDVQPVVPEVIQDFQTHDGEGKAAEVKLALDYSKLVALLIEAVKELSAEVNVLKARGAR